MFDTDLKNKKSFKNLFNIIDIFLKQDFNENSSKFCFFKTSIKSKDLFYATTYMR